MKKILYIDMDGVIADFDKEANRITQSEPLVSPDNIPGIYKNLEPIEGAIDAVHKLNESGKYEMFIATAAPWGNISAPSDKRFWIEKYFGDLFRRKMFITHRKDLLIGDYLIDDRTKNGAGEFTGKHIHFGTEKYPDWEFVLKELL